MKPTEFHLYEVTRIAEQRTVRYLCRTCGRCMEDRPEGLVLVHRGDTTVTHGGGTLKDTTLELDQDASPPSAPLRH